MKKNYLDLLDQLRAIARLGINYSKDPYDLERYNRLMDLACGEYAELTGLEPAAIRERFSRELGYITAKLGVQGALFDPQGRLLHAAAGRLPAAPFVGACTLFVPLRWRNTAHVA